MSNCVNWLDKCKSGLGIDTDFQIKLESDSFLNSRAVVLNFFKSNLIFFFLN